MRKALILTTVTTGAFAAGLWRAPAPISFAAAERIRLRAHFDSVERELRARDVSGLTPAQRAARAHVVNILDQYRVRGVFPRNIDFPNRDVPIFIDWRGTRCAFAYLIDQTGHEDLVLRIAATRNNVRAPDLKDDPQVGRWLSDNGITLAEATRIQPAYGCGTFSGDCPVAAVTPSASGGYKVTTGVSVATSVTAFTLNVFHGLPRQAGGLAAVGAGTLGIIAGAPNLGTSGQRGTLGFLNTGVGAASLALGAVRLIRNTPNTGTPARVSLAPWLGARGATGLAGRVEF